MRVLKLFLFSFLLFVPFLSFSQTWLSTVDLNLTVDSEDRIDIYTNKDGNHIILQTQSQLKYYLFSATGTQIRSTTIDNNISETPRLSCISGYLDTVYVIYKKGSKIYGKRTTDAGQNWTSLNDISLTNSSCNGISAYCDDDRLYFSWSEYTSLQYNYESYYRSIRHNSTSWSSQETVTGYTGELGGYPSVTVFGVRVFVGYTMDDDYNPIGNYDISKYRQRYNGTWQTPVSLPNAARNHLANDGSNLHAFYYDFYEEDGEFFHPLYTKHRSLSGGSWSSATQLILNCDPYNQPLDVSLAANNHLYIAYSGSKYREWNGSSWSSEYSFTSADPWETFFQQVCANGNDVYVIWIEEEDRSYTLYLRQRDYDPLAPTNLAWTDTVNNHPKISWDYVECDIDEFDVYRTMGNQAPLTWTKIATTSNPYYIDTGITVSSGGQGPNYANYKVLARDYEDNESGFSEELQIQFMSPNGSESIKLAEMTTGLLPGKLQLYENYPNPFNPTTTLSFYLPTDQNVSLTVYSLTGEKMVTLLNGFAEKGVHRVTWNGTNQSGDPVSSGIYIYQLRAGDKRLVRKMLLAK